MDAITFPPAPVNEPNLTYAPGSPERAALVTEMGIDTPCEILARTLSRVVTLGAETMRTEPLFSSAERRSESSAVFAALPKIMPTEPPAPGALGITRTG